MFKQLSLVLLGSALLAFAPAISAQVEPIRGTGCPGAPAPRHSNDPVIGHPITFHCPPCRINDIPFVIFGGPLDSPVEFPFSCGDVRCFLGCSIHRIFGGDTLTVRIPNHRELVGRSFCVQCGCVSLDRGGLCVTLSQAVKATIMAGR
jgi:hypothetical protein